MPPKVTLNPVLQAYSAFVGKSARENPERSSVSRFGVSHRDGSPRVIAATKDSCYAVNRDYKEQIANNRSRYVFFKAVADQFGGADKIPPKVRDALCAKDFGDVKFKKGEELTQGMFMTGKPLSSYRIRTVIEAITSATLADRDLLAENSVQGVLALLRAGEVDEAKLGKALTNLVDAALPPRWKTSKNFSVFSLEQRFGTRDIRELRGKILSKLNQIISTAAGGDGIVPNPKAAEDRIHVLLSELHEVFLPSQKGKGVHVQAFCDKFDTLRANWDNRSVKFEQSGMRVKSYADTITHEFDPNAPYDITEKTAEEFVGDLLHAMALSQEGKFSFNGQDGNSKTQLMAWLKLQLSELLSTTLKGEERGVMRSHALNWADKNLKLAAGASLGFQIKQVIGKFMNVDWTDVDEKVKAKLRRTPDNKGNLDVYAKNYNWLVEVRKLVDSFDKEDFSLSAELARNGLTGRFSRGEINFLKNIILTPAFGHNADKGVAGAGYLILLGRDAYPFNTHIYERMGRIGVGLTETEKKFVNEGTRQLRETLLYFADKTGDKMVFSAVEKILKSKGLTKMGLDLISRADVVKAVAYMEPYLFDGDGNGISSVTPVRSGFFDTQRITEVLRLARVESPDKDTKQIFSLKKESIPTNNRTTVPVEKPVVKREEEINTRKSAEGLAEKPAEKSSVQNENPMAPVNRPEPAAVPQKRPGRKDELKDQCFKAVFNGAPEGTISGEYPKAFDKFNKEWEKQWKIFEESNPKKSADDLVKWMKEACGADIVTLDRFIDLFQKAKKTLKSEELLRTALEQVRFNELEGCYSLEESQEIRRDIEQVLTSFFDAQTKAEPLPAQFSALRDATTPEKFREKLIKIACDAVSTRVDASRLWADAEKKELLTRQVHPLVIDEKPSARSMKDILALAVGQKRGLKQHGANTCFIKSVVNSMIGTEKGRETLANLIDDNGNYTFNPLDFSFNTDAKKFKVVITANEIENARKTGFYQLNKNGKAEHYQSKRLSDMDDLEIAVWLALCEAYGDRLGSERPGDMGEANVVANLFGYQSYTKETSGHVGKWADTVSTLGKGNIAVYRFATVDKNLTENGVPHFVSITGVTNKNKVKGYELVDSLGNETRTGLELEYFEPGINLVHHYNQVMCYEYVEG